MSKNEMEDDLNKGGGIFETAQHTFSERKPTFNDVCEKPTYVEGQRRLHDEPHGNSSALNSDEHGRPTYIEDDEVDEKYVDYMTLIELVRARDCIYNYNSVRDPSSVREAWKEIVEHFNHKYSLGHLKREWRLLRDNYRRCLHKRERITRASSGTPSSKLPQCRYYERLTFLTHTFKLKNPIELTSWNSDEEDEDEERNMRKEEERKREEERRKRTNESQQQQESITASKRKRNGEYSDYNGGSNAREEEHVENSRNSSEDAEEVKYGDVMENEDNNVSLLFSSMKETSVLSQGSQTSFNKQHSSNKDMESTTPDETNNSKTNSLNDNDAESLFCKSLIDRLRALPAKKKAEARLNIEKVFFDLEWSGK